MSKSKYIKHVWFGLKILVFPIVITVAVILLLILLTIIFPFVIYRFIVGKCAPYINPQIQKLLPTSSSILTSPNVYTKIGDSCNILVPFQIREAVDINKFQDLVSEKLVNARTPEGNLVYPELTQNVYFCMGYAFWKQVENFNVNDQVVLENKSNARFHHSELLQILKREEIKCWSKDKAMWKFIIIQNYQQETEKQQEDYNQEIPRTLIIFSIAHAVADGLSIINLLWTLFDNKPLQFQLPTAPKETEKKNVFKNMLKPLAFIFKAPYEVIDFGMSILFDRTTKPSLDERYNAKPLTCVLPKVSMKHLKQIRDKHSVGLNSLILAIFTGAYRRILLKQYGKVNSKIKIALPVPLTESYQKLRNKVGLVFIDLPIGEPDPIKRLQTIHKRFKNSKNSTMIAIVALSGQLMGCLPIQIHELLKSQTPGALRLLLTNLPGPTTELWLRGSLLEDCFGYVHNTPVSGIDILYSMLSYNGNARIVIHTHSLAFPKENDLDLMVDYIFKEIDFYDKFGNV